MAEKIVTLDRLATFKAKCDEKYSGGGSVDLTKYLNKETTTTQSVASTVNFTNGTITLANIISGAKYKASIENTLAKASADLSFYLPGQSTRQLGDYTDGYLVATSSNNQFATIAEVDALFD